ncbi:uncharacterized protein C8Q71DRAFT_856717 [Rhodofomes roseus]|uniref:Mediator of RNA polymerase II transcription subunit 25 von Willebrand factor type A domain-containing protein n=1 Tax=Rhodofomes roseus TaxID=34475 RepID=A0ABQ8KMH6_9APHY|nr:uncharacterized protein C8Q71DRAFT_856717 [Rhodofomes roseus]KAH9838797.1 hypothetical protein C8Q71DRAFT_856717 [Rhodofomes roseus]
MAEIIAVAYVVDASLTLATEWRQIVVEYIPALLHRLGELHTSPHFRFAVVAYGPAETRPTPLLGKLFFGNPQAILKELREEPMKMGLGLTGSGDSTGMAALEGLAAAIELFDMLKESLEVMTSHIIHVAAAPPDGSEHPVWNIAPNLDEVSWATLPVELQKRNINYSNILLRQLPRFQELHASAAAGSTQQPWFTVRPQHILHLSGFPTAQQKGTKRSVDLTHSVGRTAEPKRPKMEARPSSPPPSLDSSPPGPSSQPPQTAVAASQPPPQNQPVSQPPRPLRQNVALPDAQYVFQLNQAHTKKKQELAEHKQMGRAKEAAETEKELQKLQMALRQNQLRLLKARQLLAQSSQAASSANNNTSRPGSTADAAPTGTGALAESSSMPPMNNTAPSSSNVHPQSDPMPDLAGAHTKEATYMAPTQTEPVALAQTTSSSTAQIPPQPPGPDLPNLPSLASGPLNEPPSPAMVKSQVPQPSQGAPSIYVPVWDGPVTWVDSTTGRPMQAHMVVKSLDALRALQWPQSLTLEPTTEFRLQITKLQEWLKTRSPEFIPTMLMPHSGASDAKQNEERCNAIWRSIASSHRYAVVGFPNPSGMPSLKQLLLFPSRPGHFAGAYFTGPSGIPELPPLLVGGFRVSAVPLHMSELLLGLSPKDAAELETAGPREKQVKLAEHLRIYSQRLQEQQRLRMLQVQQNRQAAAPPQPQTQPQTQDAMQGNTTIATMGPPIVTSQPSQQQQPPSQQRQPIPPNNLNTLIPMNPFVNDVRPSLDQMLSLGGGNPQPQAQMPNRVPNASPNAMGMHQRVPSGGAGNVNMGGMSGVNLSHEMMQSFMQRRQDGSGGGGGAMSGGMGAGFGL